MGIYIDNRLNFGYHNSQLWKKAGKKLHALTSSFQIREHFTMQTNCKCFYDFKFSYCPLIWLFHSRAIEQSLSRVHEKTLRLIYLNQNKLTFQEFLEKKTRPLAYTRRIYKPWQLKFIRLNKTKFSPEIVCSLFEFTNKNYNLRNASILKGTAADMRYFARSKFFRS